MVTNLVLVGANSEISQKLIETNNSSEFNIYGISTKEIGPNFLKVSDYYDDAKKIIDFIDEIENPNIIFFNGYLKENRDIYSPNDEEINNTIYITFLIPFLLTLEICKSISFNKLVYISSIAAEKPRYKNYIYGICKRTLEESVYNLKNKETLIIRFGKVKTKMSKEHQDPPFTITAEKASDIIIKNLHRTGTIHSSFGIYLSSLIIKFTPLKFINFLERGILR